MNKLLLICLFFAISSADAEGLATLSTCYSAKVKNPNPAHGDTDFFVVVDQTTLFDLPLKQSIANNIRPFIQPGNTISVIEFSAFTQGHYTNVLAVAKLDPLLPNDQRNSISKPVLAHFDQCISNQLIQARLIVGEGLRSAIANSSNGIERSDIEYSLKDISSKVAHSYARRKVLLIASDMLENSSVTSFYANKSVRKINPAFEMDLAIKNDMLGDFDNAEVFVIGAGLLEQDSAKNKGTFHSPQVMSALRDFWAKWFAKSNATLVDFGQPALLNPVK